MEPIVYVLGRIGVPVRVGEVAKTKTPEPVSSDSADERKEEVAVVVAKPALSKKRAREVVRPEKVKLPERVAPLIAGEVRVLLVRVWVPPTVTTEAELVPAVVTRRSPVETVSTPVE